MDIEQVIEHFGGVGQTAARLGVTRQSVYDWRKSGKIPFARQAQIELESNGAFKTTRGKRARK
jgi:predicted site-specific integrase-resolvase